MADFPRHNVVHWFLRLEIIVILHDLVTFSDQDFVSFYFLHFSVMTARIKGFAFENVHIKTPEFLQVT